MNQTLGERAANEWFNGTARTYETRDEAKTVLASIVDNLHEQENKTKENELLQYREAFHELATVLGIKAWSIQEPRFVMEAVTALATLQENKTSGLPDASSDNVKSTGQKAHTEN